MGYRGSGKTSVGKKIAAATWKDFVDLDAEIVKRFDGRSIADIWATDGEAAFRQTETDALRDLLGRDNLVLALGGGAVVAEENQAMIRDASDAKRIYLACKPAILAERLGADPHTAASRPSLTGQAAATGLDEITTVLAQRDPIYRDLADAVFDVSYVDIPQAAAYLQRHHL